MPPASKPSAASPAAPGAFLATETEASEVEQTSLAGRNNAPDECMVQFAKWTPHANTAYQKGQFAGFKVSVARRLVAAGSAYYATARDAALGQTMPDRVMITK